MAETKKNILTYEGLKALEEELHELKVNRRREVAQKIKEAREQGDLSENAEYDAAKEEQRDIELRIEEIDKILKKCGEEASEIIIAAKNPDAEELKYEISDFLYHMMVLMAECDLTWEDITKELSNRR